MDGREKREEEERGRRKRKKKEEEERGRRKRKKNERSIEGKNVGQDRDARRGVGFSPRFHLEL